MEAGTSTYTDLMDSLKEHDYSTSKQLLEYGADPNCISTEDGVSAFHLAVGLDSQTSLKLVELCIQYGGNPNVRSHEGMTPVMVAASWGRFQALQMLLANGGDPELRDEDDKNALDHAIVAASWDCQQLLQQHLNCTDEYNSDEEPNFYYERYYSSSSSLSSPSVCSPSLRSPSVCSPSLSSPSVCSPSLSSPSVCSPSLCSPCSETSLNESKGYKGVFHGFDVTSPDNPFAFIKANPLPTQLDKTVSIHHNESCLKTLDKSLDSSSGTLDVSLDNNNGENLEFIYHDKESGVELIEKRCYNSPNNSNLLDESHSLDETVLYDWQDVFKGTSAKCEDLDNLTCQQLQLELVSHGYNPGPITQTTKDIYTHKLMKLKEEKGKTKEDNTSKDYSQELTDFMQDCSISDAEDDEELMCAAFQNPDPQRKWREGVVKSSFNYLLLDPRVTRNLPHRCKGLTDSETFEIFLSAVFYIGKGKRGRPYAHFYEGLEQIRNPRMKPSDKVQHIVDIWGSGLGVVSLHVFQGVIPVEAYTREACMIDSLSLARLTNARRGDYYGVASTWSTKRQKQLGSHLLHKCMQIFLIEGERQIRPADLHGGNK